MASLRYGWPWNRSLASWGHYDPPGYPGRTTILSINYYNIVSTIYYCTLLSTIYYCTILAVNTMYCCASLLVPIGRVFPAHGRHSTKKCQHSPRGLSKDNSQTPAPTLATPFRSCLNLPRSAALLLTSIRLVLFDLSNAIAKERWEPNKTVLHLVWSRRSSSVPLRLWRTSLEPTACVHCGIEFSAIQWWRVSPLLCTCFSKSSNGSKSCYRILSRVPSWSNPIQVKMVSMTGEATCCDLLSTSSSGALSIV